MTGQPYQGETPPPLPGQPPQGQPNGWSQQQQYRPPPPPPYYQQPPHSPPPRAGGGFFQSCMVAGCATLLAPAVLLVGFLLLAGALVNSGFGDASSALDTYSGASSLFKEKVIREGSPDQGTLVIISIQGEIAGNGSGLEGTGMLGAVSEQLRAAAENRDVKAVILQIDSPGGGLTASDILYNEIMKLRGKGKIVVAWGGSLMASGGYYIAAASDGIMASPTATVGSIGVIMQRFQVDGLMKLIGLKADPIMAGANKDMGSPFRDLTPEERALFQENVDHAHRRFIGIVAKGRGKPEAEIEKLADGRIFTADACLKNSLVDKVGYMEDAIAWTEELAERKDMRVVAYRRVFSFADILSDTRSGAAALAGGWASGASHPRLQAEWTGE